MLKKLFTVRNLAIVLVIVAMFVISGLLGLKVPSPVISLAAEPIFAIGGFKVTNSLITAWLVMLVLVWLAWNATRRMPKDLDRASTSELVPHGVQNLMEIVVEALHGLVKEIAGNWTPKIFPVVATIFLFVLVANWGGLLPGFGSIGLLEHPHEAGATGFVAHGAILTGVPATAEATPATATETTAEHTEGAAAAGYIVVPFLRAPSSDLNFTLALAVVAVVLTQVFGIQSLGRSYFKKFFDLSGFKEGALMGGIGIFVGVLELIGELSRLLSFSFRLFGNVFAGEVLLMVMAFLIPYIASLPFYGLELFVGFIQAAVFMMLAVVFMSMATQGHGSEEHH